MGGIWWYDVYMKTSLQLNIPVLFLHNRQWVMLDTDGVVACHDGVSAQQILQNASDPIIVCYTPFVCSRLKVDNFPALDMLELWAFVKPAVPVVPTIAGILHALNMYPEDDSCEAMAAAVWQAIRVLITTISQESGRPSTEDLLVSLAKSGWGWAPPLLQVLNLNMQDFIHKPLTEGLDIWHRLPEWENKAPPPQANTKPINSDEVGDRLRTFLGSGAEHRPQQIALCQSLVPAFQAKTDDAPNIVIAEGGTGVGKTYAYLAPATVWAEKNDAPVWISTYTKNLQHQIYEQVTALYPDIQQRKQRVILCKGRENYLCLSRFETMTQQVSQNARILKAMVLLARWAEHSMDGDLNGKDFPSWLVSVVDIDGTLLNRLTLQYDVGETHAGCSHDNCFVDLAAKKAKYADIVITNHAFVLHRAIRNYENGEQDTMPHIVFDEAHHLFEACDSAFSTAFSAWDSFMLRRFLIKKETIDMWQSGGTLTALIDAVYKQDDTITEHRIALQQQAECLTADEWQSRFEQHRPSGDMESLLCDIYVYICNNIDDYGYNMEIRTDNMPQNIRTLAQAVMEQLRDMLPPAHAMLQQAQQTFTTESDSLHKHERLALQNLISALTWRVIRPVESWCDILISLAENAPQQTCIDRLFVNRWTDNNDVQRLSNVGCVRHQLDPMKGFYEIVLHPNRGAVMTSATLCDQNDDWLHIRTGTQHAQPPPIITTHASPFDYHNNSKILCVTDVQKNDTHQLAGAYTALFTASGGGALGVFTNIRRLQKVGKIIRPHLAKNGIDLYAQHLNHMTITTLIDIFKQDKNSCLLGTDAVRDGVDVPGDSLRLLVLERIPWAMSNILNTTRDKHFTTVDYKQALVRMKLQQAFGRLLRTKTDRGVCVCLQKIPQRFTSAFPDDTEIIHCTLAEACDFIRDIL